MYCMFFYCCCTYLSVECIVCSFIVVVLTYQSYSSHAAIEIVCRAGNTVMFMLIKHFVLIHVVVVVK